MTAIPTPADPARLDALIALAQRQHRAGRLDEAVAAYREILALRPDIAEAHNNLGVALGSQGRLDQAQIHFEQALTLRPDYADALNNLGNVFRELGQLEQAAARFEQLLALRPVDAAAHYNLGVVLGSLGKLDEAAVRYRQAVALRPDYAEAHNNLGVILAQQNRLDEAVKQFEQAVALRPEYADAHNNLGKMFSAAGNFAQAAACFSRALAIRPDLTEAHYRLAELKTFQADDPDLAALEALTADAGRLPPADRAHLHFALGKALEDVGQYDRAFRQWIEANALMRRQIDFDEAACQRDLRLAAERFDASLLDRLRGLGDPSPAPIFIVGMPRSGSTLIEQILASHPQVHSAGEVDNLARVVQAASGSAGQPIPSAAWIASLDAAALRRLGQAYLASLPPLADGQTRITDKMLGNFLYVGLIHLILPNARIVHAVRDPVDTCVSCFSRHFATGQAYSYDLAELGRHWRGYHALMAHWRSVLPAGALLDVSYEAVVDNLEAQARRLLDYCGLRWDDRCLSFHLARRPVATFSNVQVRQPLYRSSLARWRRYEAHLQPLLAELEGCRKGECGCS